jgi:ATP-dependent exoDNAse (exonuclease V) beta subunit
VWLASGCLHELERDSKDVAQNQHSEIQRQEQERLQAEAIESKREANEHEYKKWRVENNVLVNKFLEIAERKVSLLDEYGEENWDALRKELEIFLSKIAKMENDDIGSIKNILFLRVKPKNRKERMRLLSQLSIKGNVELLEKYTVRRSRLDSEFRSYHESRKRQTNSSDFTDLSGIDFETYLAKLLS